MDSKPANHSVYRQLSTLIFTFACATATHGAELTLQLTADDNAFRAVQHLERDFEFFESGALTNKAADNMQTYQAIRCDGSWGAMKYQVSLASGPGFSLRKSGETLLLQIVEYAVISEDRNIQAMKIHCTDLAPKPVVREIAMIELDPAKETLQQQTLANGYQLKYHYRP